MTFEDDRTTFVKRGDAVTKQWRTGVAIPAGTTEVRLVIGWPGNVIYDEPVQDFTDEVYEGETVTLITVDFLAEDFAETTVGEYALEIEALTPDGPMTFPEEGTLTFVLQEDLN